MLSAVNNESLHEGILCDLTSLWLCSPWYVTVQVKFLLKTGKANEWIKSYFRDMYKSVEVNIKIVITMHFYTGEVQNTVFHKGQFKGSYIFLST